MRQDKRGGPGSASFAEVAGPVAHDIINMVMIVLTYTEQLSRKLDRADPAQEDVREIRGAAERAAALTRELLTFVRRQAPARIVVDLHALLAGLDAPIRRIAGDTVKVDISLAATSACVLGERRELEQTVLNLAINARDAMPRGGALTIATSDAGADGTGARVQVLVRDTGVGMDEATRVRIFEPFFSTKGPDAGTGLGLSIVAGVVANMKGSISVESVEGEGTAFRILLPVVP
jgi:two-component system cell cycle sensor histidine kinase/response regulator CckA